MGTSVDPIRFSLLKTHKFPRRAGCALGPDAAVCDETGLFLSDQNRNIHALELDGSPRWEVQGSGFEVECRVGGVLISRNDMTSRVRGLSIQTGKRKWETAADPWPIWPGKDEVRVLSEEGDELLVIDAESGRIRRQIPLKGQVGSVLGDRRLVQDDDAGMIRCLNLADGKPLWERPIEASRGKKAREELSFKRGGEGVGVLVFQRGEQLLALDLRNGDRRWERRISGLAKITPARHFGPDSVLIQSERASLPSRIACLDLRSGETRWERKADAASGLSSYSVRPIGVDFVTTTGFGGQALALLSGRDGSVLTTYKPKSVYRLEAWEDIVVVLGQYGHVEVLQFQRGLATSAVAKTANSPRPAPPQGPTAGGPRDPRKGRAK